MYSLLAVAFVALTTAAPVDKPAPTLTAEQVSTAAECATAVGNLNIEGILKNFGSDDKVPIWTAMKSAAKVQCGVLTGKVRPAGAYDACADKCGELNIEGILKNFGQDNKVSIWRAMKGACFGECDAIYKNAATVTASSVTAATTRSDDTQQIVAQSSGDESLCSSQVANLNIEGILKNFGQENKVAIWTAMKESALTQCYINANEKVYKPSGSAMMECNEKCGNLNIENILANFGSVDKKAVWAAMKSACSIECDNIYTAA